MTEDAALVEVDLARQGAAKLKPGKALNFPDTEIGIPSLTPKDLDDLDFIARHADMVGLAPPSQAVLVHLVLAVAHVVADALERQRFPLGAEECSLARRAVGLVGAVVAVAASVAERLVAHAALLIITWQPVHTAEQRRLDPGRRRLARDTVHGAARQGPVRTFHASGPARRLGKVQVVGDAIDIRIVCRERRDAGGVQPVLRGDAFADIGIDAESAAAHGLGPGADRIDVAIPGGRPRRRLRSGARAGSRPSAHEVRCGRRPGIEVAPAPHAPVVADGAGVMPAHGKVDHAVEAGDRSAPEGAIVRRAVAPIAELPAVRPATAPHAPVRLARARARGAGADLDHVAAHLHDHARRVLRGRTEPGRAPGEPAPLEHAALRGAERRAGCRRVRAVAQRLGAIPGRDVDDRPLRDERRHVVEAAEQPEDRLLVRDRCERRILPDAGGVRAPARGVREPIEDAGLPIGQRHVDERTGDARRLDCHG
ncbi:uncharacterized protein SOCE26_018910 [Sorangium cellulosum]|uniref:Uncharacterized protein n=1 Tax=Sorangium cellulosum TaxID=56 RepID=A0A2L0EMI0_SORCE|nr:uncharacterized protein SOCE26_018910 [Sorangium cellulosum]